VLNKMTNWLKANLQGPLVLQNCVYLIIFLVLVTFIVNHPSDLAEWKFFGTVLALTLLFVLNLVWSVPAASISTQEKKVQAWVFLILSAILLLAVIWMSGQYDAAYLLAVLCIQAGIKQGVWPAGVIFGAANLIAWSGLLAIMGLPAAIIALLKSVGPGVLFALLLTTLLERYARQTRRAEALLQELQRANAALEMARQKEVDLPVAEERVRLARDIHDGLGHHLTVLSIQLQAASKLADRNPQAVTEAIQVCREEAQAALEEVRHSVGLMRQGPLESRPLPEALAFLAQGFDRHTGIHTTLECSGTYQELPTYARETLYRAAQESLTNVQKHGNNVQRVSVHLRYETGFVRLSVMNDGQRPVPNHSGNQTGFGLAGIRERVTRLGGALRVEPGARDGFELEICIPVQGGENDPGITG